MKTIRNPKRNSLCNFLRTVGRCGTLALALAAGPVLSAHAAPAGWTLVIHGGAGGIPKDLPAAERAAIDQALHRALEEGGRILAAGGSSLDAVQRAVEVMEESGVLNSGRGAVLNHDGVAELDAAIMDGASRKAGSVAALHHVAHPIDLARAVMDHSRHVLLVGEGAEQFAREQGMALMPESYFVTERRRRDLQRAIEHEAAERAPAPLPTGSKGTVGAVALDTHGNLAAATSTGGLTNKHPGRVGDSPIIGAGTYAQNGVCAISATGVGELFIRYTAAADVCARVKYRGQSISEASAAVIDELSSVGGEGGMIAVDAQGNVATPYSSPSMLRGRISADQAATVVIGEGG